MIYVEEFKAQVMRPPALQISVYIIAVFLHASGIKKHISPVAYLRFVFFFKHRKDFICREEKRKTA
jgi:hypothetical protein